MRGSELYKALLVLLFKGARLTQVIHEWSLQQMVEHGSRVPASEMASTPPAGGRPPLFWHAGVHLDEA